MDCTIQEFKLTEANDFFNLWGRRVFTTITTNTFVGFGFFFCQKKVFTMGLVLGVVGGGWRTSEISDENLKLWDQATDYTLNQWLSLEVGKGLLGNQATINLGFLVMVKEHDLHEFCRQTPKTKTCTASYFIFYLKPCMWKIAKYLYWVSERSMRKTWKERLCSCTAWFVEGQLTNSCSLSRNKNTKQFCQQVKVNLFFKWYCI